MDKLKLVSLKKIVDESLSLASSSLIGRKYSPSSSNLIINQEHQYTKQFYKQS